MNETVKRYNTDLNVGLNEEQVEERMLQNLYNYDTSVSTKSIKSIIIGNFFTIFNLLNFVLALAVFLVGSYKNLLFMGVVLCNTLISTYQEIHSKRVIDKLAIVAQNKVKAIRNGKEVKIGINEVVLDDILKFQVGNQIITDSIILDGNVEVDESFITGESEAVYKKKGDMLFSGSFIVSGKCTAKVEHIAEDNYTSKISSEAKYVKKINSEIMNSLNKVIKVVSIIIIPVGLLLLNRQLHIDGNTVQAAVVNTVAALIGMIPEGLILLTSTVLAVSVVRLSKDKVLVQELYCIETLARVDTLCLDKTGTITEGKMEVHSIIPTQSSQEEMEIILGEIAKASEDTNVTIEAIRNKYIAKENWKVEEKIPFSSLKKWSGINFKEKGSYIIGAPEFILGDKIEKYRDQLNEYSKENRVIALVHSKTRIINRELPRDVNVIGFVLIRDVIRKEANKTLEYFKEQGVNIIIISGDNPVTVSNIAKRAGVIGAENYIDSSTLKTEQDIQEAIKKYTIFGRVSPTQKKQIVQALKKDKHTVAMTGDGVNDVLALKEADCSIAIASGTDAARNVSQLVLLDSNFKSMPKIVAEGRRTINNIERSAQLFLVKTIYSTILAIIFLFISMPYPFKPIQLTLLSVATIGIPSFVLALQPNKDRVKGMFLTNILSKALPVALTVVINILIIVVLSKLFNISEEIYSTICVILTSATGFTLLYKLCKPFNLLRGTLFFSMIGVFLVQCIFFKDWFYIADLNKNAILITGVLIIISVCIYSLFNFLVKLLKGID